MEENIKVGDIFYTKVCGRWFKKNEKTFLFENGDKVLILKKELSNFNLIDFKAFHFKKGIISFPFLKGKFEQYFRKLI